MQDASLFALVSPADGADLSEAVVSVTAVLGASAYQVRLATTETGLGAATPMESTTPVFDLDNVPIVNETTWWWQGRVKTTDGIWSGWTAARSFVARWTSSDIAITFSGLTQVGGVSNMTTTTSLTLSFSADPTTLTTDNITLTGATKGALSGTGTTRSLEIYDITVADGATVSVAVSNPADFLIADSPKTVVVYRALPLLTMMLVAGGTFDNGTANVTLTSFAMSKYEITQDQYTTVTGVNPSNFTGDSSRPVELVTWYDAVEFCNKLSEREGRQNAYTITERTPTGGYPITSATVTMDISKNGYRLPTEMEWMWAAMGASSDARSGDIVGGVNTGGYTKGYAGSTETDGSQVNIGDYAWYSTNSGSTTHPVGTAGTSGHPNELVLYDMSGNVFEWCWDWYGDYSTSVQTDPTGPSSGTARVDRGGSWFSDASYCAVSYRGSHFPGGRTDDIGFRVVSR